MCRTCTVLLSRLLWAMVSRAHVAFSPPRRPLGLRSQELELLHIFLAQSNVLGCKVGCGASSFQSLVGCSSPTQPSQPNKSLQCFRSASYLRQYFPLIDRNFQGIPVPFPQSLGVSVSALSVVSVELAFLQLGSRLTRLYLI